MKKIVDIILVTKKGNKMPFFCSICREVDRTKDYLRVYYEREPNGECTHTDCFQKLWHPKEE